MYFLTQAFESQFQHSSTQHHDHGTKASFRVASLCFVFLRRLHVRINSNTEIKIKNPGRSEMSINIFLYYFVSVLLDKDAVIREIIMLTPYRILCYI